MDTQKCRWIGALLAVLVVLTLMGCATTKKDWHEANQQGTIEAYHRFLVKHPKAEQAGEANRLIGELMKKKVWDDTVAANSVSGYEKFLKSNPNSKYAANAGRRLDELRFAQAKAKDTKGDYDAYNAYEAYLKQHPDGSGAGFARSRQREIHYALAQKNMSAPLIKSFLAKYDEGDDAETLKAALPAAEELEKARSLGKSIMRHAPQSFIQMTNFNVTGMETTRSDPTAEDLKKLEEMLQKGADPNAVRIAGFQPAGKTPVGNGLVSYSSGRPGMVVRAENGGITLLEYCRANGLKTIEALLIKHGAK